MSPKSVTELVSELRRFDPAAPDRQWQVTIALGHFEHPHDRAQAVPALTEALGPRFGALVRSHAAEALGNLGDMRAVPALIEALKDPYRLARSYAARALGKLGDAQAIGPLLTVMHSDEFFGTRAEAAEALGMLCAGKGTDECRKARRALLVQKKAEEERKKLGEEEGRAVRVLGEVDRSLERLGQLLEEAETKTRAIQMASERGNFQEVTRLAREVAGILREATRVKLAYVG